MALFVRYMIAGSDFAHAIEVAEEISIEDLIEEISRKEGRTDLTQVKDEDGKVLDPDELVFNYLEDGIDQFYIYSDEPEYPDLMMTGPARHVEMETEYGHGMTAMEVENLRQIRARAGHLYVHTTLSYESMTEGTEVNIRPESTKSDVIRQIRSTFHIGTDKDVHLYFSEGLRFSDEYGGRETRVDDLFNSIDGLKAKLYAIVTDHIDPAILDEEIDEVCDYSSDSMKMLLSPIHRCVNGIGYSQIAVLLGYLSHNGNKSEELLQACAYCTNFAPLVCGMKLLCSGKIDGHTLISITAPLFTLARAMIPSTVGDGNVFEYLLKVCCFIVHFDGIQTITDPAVVIDRIYDDDMDDDDADGLQIFARESNQRDRFAIFRPDDTDGGSEFVFAKISPPRAIELENIFNNAVSFRPIAPLSLRDVHSTSIVHYARGRLLLMLNWSNEDEVNVLNPKTGRSWKASPENLARIVKNTTDDLSPHLIEPDQVLEVIQVLVDCSGSMSQDLSGGTGYPERKYVMQKNGERIAVPITLSRMAITKQYLISLVNRLYGFGIPCLLGLSSFASTVNEIMKLSPLSSDLENAVGSLVHGGDTRLWDGIESGIEKLIEVKNSGRYKNARFRVLVFSDGKDKTSDADPMELTQQMIDNDIVLDAVYVSTQVRNVPTDLCKMAHLTGGVAFKPADESEGLRLFEKESFMAAHLRPPHDVVRVTPGTWENAPAEFDNTVGNEQLITRSKKPPGLYTPRYVLSRARGGYHDGDVNLDRTRRILKELRHIVRDGNEDLHVFVNEQDFNEWKVYFLGPGGTPYEGCYWYMSIAFPEEYPSRPPIFRFISIAYHGNISEDGRICLPSLSTAYKSHSTVLSLIYEVIEMLRNPDLRNFTQVERLLLIHQDPAEYRSNALESCENAGESVAEWIRGCRQRDDKDYELSDDEPTSEADEDPSFLTIELDGFDAAGRPLDDLSDGDCI